MEKQQVVIGGAVFEGLEEVRLSGLTNMLDRPRVIELARMMGYDETAEWLSEHRSEYAQLIFNGAEIKEERKCADSAD